MICLQLLPSFLPWTHSNQTFVSTSTETCSCVCQRRVLCGQRSTPLFTPSCPGAGLWRLTTASGSPPLCLVTPLSLCWLPVGPLSVHSHCMKHLLHFVAVNISFYMLQNSQFQISSLNLWSELQVHTSASYSFILLGCLMCIYKLTFLKQNTVSSPPQSLLYQAGRALLLRSRILNSSISISSTSTPSGNPTVVFRL